MHSVRASRARLLPSFHSVGSAQAGGFASCESWQGQTGRAGAGARGRRTLKTKVRLPGCSYAQGREKLGLGEQDFLASRRTGPPLWTAQLLRSPKPANNSAMLPPAGPGSPGSTAAAEGEETGWRFFIVTNIKLGLSPLSLPPYPNTDRKQINL